MYTVQEIQILINVDSFNKLLNLFLRRFLRDKKKNAGQGLF